MGKDFHSRCGKKGPTISLFKIKDGDCIGGFTKAQWDGPSDIKFVGDSDAFLFNLTRSRLFKATEKGGIFCWSVRGPIFYASNNPAELGAYEPFKGDNKCISWANEPGYCISIEDGKNMLTNQKDGNFTITELEVWEILNTENIIYKVNQ